MHSSNAYKGMIPPRDPGHSVHEDASPALLVRDGQGNLSYANSRARGMLGVGAQGALGQPVRSMFRLEAREGDPLAADRIEDMYHRGVMEVAIDDCVLVHPDGQRLRVICEIAAIGDGAALIILRPARKGTDRGVLAYRASHDALTGLPNRSYLQERLENIHRSAAARRAVYSLLLLDLDHFKLVNDRFGHATGDQVLVQVGRRIVHNVRELDTVGRWGGEEFLCLLPDVSRPLAAEIAERIRSGLEVQPVEFQGRQIRVTSSIGMVTFPEDGANPDHLLAKADAALYEAKRSGRNRIRSVTSQTGNVFALAHIVENSLREGRVLPAYQTMVNLASGEVCGAQAVARIQLDDHQVMDAACFIPAAEQLQLVHQIDHRIIQTVATRCGALALNGEPISAMFINFSADFLRHPDLVEDVRATIKKHCDQRDDAADAVIPLVVEITERQFTGDRGETSEALQPFLDMGLRIAIDDFGIGYSSLDSLIDLPVSFIKLEGSLVRRISVERRVCSVLQGIQDLAAELGIITVAEGVENEETADFLRAIGVNWGQGYYFSRPVFQP